MLGNAVRFPSLLPVSIDSELRIALIRGATLTGRVMDIHLVASATIEIVGTLGIVGCSSFGADA